MSSNVYGSLRRAPVEARSRPSRPLGVAAACALALACVWCVAELIPAAHARDALTLHDFMLLSRPHLDSVANLLIHALEPLPLAAWGVALVLAALVRGRPRIALAVIAVIGLSQLTTEALKPLLAHPHLHVHGTHIGAASWPSGHSTAALAVAMSAVLVAPARRRPLVAAAGIAFALAVGCSLLILAWHLPSDVLGGYLVASLWTALTIAALRAAERRWPSAHRRVS